MDEAEAEEEAEEAGGEVAGGEAAAAGLVGDLLEPRTPPLMVAAGGRWPSEGEIRGPEGGFDSLATELMLATLDPGKGTEEEEEEEEDGEVTVVEEELGDRWFTSRTMVIPRLVTVD